MTHLLRLLILSALAATMAMPLYAKKTGDKTTSVTGGQAIPGPFNPASDWPRDQAAISTGYYLLDSDDGSQSLHVPNPTQLLRSLDLEIETWHRIVSGPNQFPSEHWTTHPEGHAYFRNPGDVHDSTDNAFAGPIDIGFPFYFNGVRYDSFYVSCNGVIALSNRRYYYDDSGQRTIPAGATTAWDAESDDLRTRSDAQATNGLNDAVADDWGFLHVACGGDTRNPLGGIRSPNNTALDDDAIAGSGLSEDAPIIAPFWDDWHLSQFNSHTNRVEDYGQVWYKRSRDRRELTIYFVNLAPIGNKQQPDQPLPDIEFKANIRPGAASPNFAISAQITLKRDDGAIAIVPERYSVNNVEVKGRQVDPAAILRQNATVGVRGKARYRDAQNELRRYSQFTEAVHNGQVFLRESEYQRSGQNIFHGSTALQFKQMRNVLRTVGVRLYGKNPADGSYTRSVADPNHFEVLSGDKDLSSFQPVVVFQNLSNDVQGPDGVNYQAQDINFLVSYRLTNDLRDNSTIVSHTMCVDSAALADPAMSGVRLIDYAGRPIVFNGDGVPPYAFVEVTFPPVDALTAGKAEHFGRLSFTALAEPYACDGVEYPEPWYFDNVKKVQIYGMRVLSGLYDNASGFNYSKQTGPIPNADIWRSKGVEIVDGTAMTFHPPPPRDKVDVEQNFSLSYDSPVMRLNRVDLDGSDFAPAGDELISYPINLGDAETALLSFSYQRTGRPPSNTFDRGWSDELRVGPEARVVQNSDWAATPVQQPDVLEVHLAYPGAAGLSSLVNIPDDGWSVHYNSRDPDNPITDNPALTIFGGGGYGRGFSEQDRDSSLTVAQGLRYYPFDTGKDFIFNKGFVEIPDFMLHAVEDGPSLLRVKFAVKASDNGLPAYPRDDADDFFIDNVTILTDKDGAELEVASVEIERIAATAFNADQANCLTPQVTLVNNSEVPSRAFACWVQIMEYGDPFDRTVYSRAQTLPFLRGETQTLKVFPQWRGKDTRPGRYQLCARILYPSGDINSLNDGVHGFYDLEFNNFIGHDYPSAAGRNDVPQFAGVAGKGLNLGGQSSPLFNSSSAYGADGGDAPGRILVRFDIEKPDTILGYQAYFGGLNPHADAVECGLYPAVVSSPAPVQIKGSVITRKRGEFDLDANGDSVTTDKLFNAYGTYLLPEPLVLEPGAYWLYISQLDARGFELGGSSHRMGMQTLDYATTSEVGAAGLSILLEEGLRERNRANDLLNSRRFLYENELGSFTLTDFTPNIGNPGYAHLTHAGLVGSVNTFSRGSWVPMLRLYTGYRDYSDPPIYTNEYKPVELVDFSGYAMPPSGIELLWNTASELNNAGFHVERRAAGSHDEFNALGFVQGQGSSTVKQHYDFLDAQVVRGAVYEYRLRQVDYDGTTDFSRLVTVSYSPAVDPQLTNSPNPCSASTDFAFDIPAAAHARLELFDAFGNSVRVLHNGPISAASRQKINWDTRDDKGAVVSAGVYFCRLTIGDHSTVHTLQVIR